MTEVRIAIFRTHREVVGEGVLDAAADRVADTRVAERIGQAVERIDIVVLEPTKRGTARCVEENAIDGEAEAAAHRALDVGRARHGDAAERVVRLGAGAVDVSFKTEHRADGAAVAEERHRARRVVVADMRAADHTVLVDAVRRQADGSSRGECQRSVRTEVVADLATDVDAGPREHRRRRGSDIDRRCPPRG